MTTTAPTSNTTNEVMTGGGGNALKYSHGLGKEDPNYQDLMMHSTEPNLPLRNYYSEFRLGQGDPLLRAAMANWPYTSVGDEAVQSTNKPKRKQKKHPKPVPSAGSGDPLYDNSFWYFNDIVHIEKHKLVGSKPTLNDDEEKQERRKSH